MASYKSKTVLVADNGLFVEFARLLSKDFGTVLYWTPWESSFPKSNSLLVGCGVEGVKRIDSFWPMLDEIDLFVFPDVYHGPLQVYLASIGKRVWGSRMGEELELLRDESKKALKKAGIAIGDYKVVTGLDALRDYLHANPEQYVKISKTRGDMETFHAKNYSLIEPRLDELEYTLGVKKKITKFVVEKAIKDAVEIGYDGFAIDGQFPENAMIGLEIKDEGFLMKSGLYADQPTQVRDVNTKMASLLASYQYRSFISSELRVTKDGTAYAIDPCARAGSPPFELFQIMIKNLPDIVWEGADGVLVEPELSAKWGAELLLLSTWADKNWQAVQFPKDLRDNVKLRNLTVIEGKCYVVPQWVGLPEIGAVVATGDTMEDAIKSVIEISSKVEGHYIEVVTDSLDEASDAIEKLKTFGIEL